MRKSLTLTLVLAAGAAASAQTGTNPGFSRKPSPSWMIINSFNSVPGKNVEQVFHVKTKTDKDGRWTTCLTARGLPAFWGGNGTDRGVLTGEFAPYPNEGWFVADNPPLAKALNSGDTWNLTLDPTGLWAIFDRATGVWVSKRANTTSAWPAPKMVQGFGNLRDVMPALAPVGGKMKVFYTDRKAILMQDIDLNMTAPKLSNSPVVVSRPLQAGAKPLRPTPLIGGDGDAEGLFLAEEVKPHSGTGTGDADPVWAADLDPATPPIMVVQRTDWQPGGSPAGGFLSFGHDIRPRFHLMHSEIAWMAGDVEPIGGTADIKVSGVNHSHPTPLVTPVYASARTLPKVPVPNLNGWFALDLATLFPLGILAHTTREGSAVLRFRVPNDTGLRGVKLALQAIVADTKKQSLTFTNTAFLSIQ